MLKSLFGYLLLLIHATCPKYVNLHLCKSYIMSTLIPNSFFYVDIASSITPGYTTDSSQDRHFEDS